MLLHRRFDRLMPSPAFSEGTIQAFTHRPVNIFKNRSCILFFERNIFVFIFNYMPCVWVCACKCSAHGGQKAPWSWSYGWLLLFDVGAANFTKPLPWPPVLTVFLH